MAPRRGRRTAANGDGGIAAPQVDGAPTPAEQAPASPVDPQTEIRTLIELAGYVLRVLRGVDAGPLELPASLADQALSNADLEAAGAAKPELIALCAALQRYADGTVPLSEGGETVGHYTGLLRVLLERILRTRLPGGATTPSTPWPSDREFESAREHASSLVFDRADGPQRIWTVRNQTAKPLTLHRRDGVDWVLPAYGERTVDAEPQAVLELAKEEASGEVEVDSRLAAGPGLDLSILLAVVPAVVVGWTIGDLWGAVIAGAAALALAIGVVGFQTFKQGGERVERMKAVLGNIPAWTAQSVTFLLILGAGIAVPAVATVFGADLRDEVRHVWEGTATATEYLTFVGRSMQVALISIASLLPALLYFQFDRDRLSTLREKFVHQIFRLDPTMTNQGAIKAKYGRLIDEIYGPERKGRHRKLPPGRRAPVFVATLLIVLGWLFVLLNPEVGAIENEEQLASLLSPRESPVAFAFLGAYFFTLFALLRGYVRRDLRPKSYSDISVRIIAVGILAWVLQVALPDADYLLVLAFMTGLVPQAALNKIREVYLAQGARGLVGGGRAPKKADDPLAVLDDRLPLTNLEGIDLYDRTRLASEGVTNIEALAHHDLIELMLQTRIPVPRLVDWTDQAMLHLHVSDNDRATLACYGIRTATDLLSACERAKCRGDDKQKEFWAILGETKPGRPPRMQVIVDSMSDEEWITNLRFWHAGELGVCLDEDEDVERTPAGAGGSPS
jgi:hypothetical protein